MATESDSGRKLRHKERKVYVDELSDDEIEGKRTFNLDSKLTSPNYNAKFVKEMKPEDFTMEYVQQNGLCDPIIFYDKTGLGMRIPSENFKVSDVKQCVGSRRVVDVMDVTTQKGLNMTMKDWCQYYEDKKRDRLLNVISLEFSHTRLDNYVECPKLVRELDWVDCVWPKHLKECQTDGTNIIEKMKYPKVQKYCLMSVAGCYTDFHIDFGGTSVWYHVLHGSKIFWMIPPTKDNVHRYEQWVLSGKQGDIFFADLVKECQRIRLEEGHTFIIPTGWIHGVFTPDDSLVFGGNFIHSFNMVKQLQVVEVEDRTHVPQKFRYPFFGEMCWYVIARYVHCMTGKNHLLKSDTDSSSAQQTDCEKSPSPPTDITHEGDKPANDPSTAHDLEPPELSPPHSPIYDEHSYTASPASPLSPSSLSDKIPQLAEAFVELQPLSEVDRKKYLSPDDDEDSCSKSTNWKRSALLTKWELEGLRAMLDHLLELPMNKRCIPKELSGPDALIKDVEMLLRDHAHDVHADAVTGKSIISIPEEEKNIKLRSIYPTSKKPRLPKGSTKKAAAGVRHRRTRCKTCEACTRSDCGECNFCKDMRKFGGPGRMKQSCISRQCMRPSLANIAVCQICELDASAAQEPENDSNALMECGICWEITHPACLREKNPELTSEGIVNEDLPNSWECPKCCNEGLQGQIKPRVVKGGGKRADSRQASVESESSVSSHHSQGNVKVELTDTEVSADQVTVTDPDMVVRKESTSDGATVCSANKRAGRGQPPLKSGKTSQLKAKQTNGQTSKEKTSFKLSGDGKMPLRQKIAKMGVSPSGNRESESQKAVGDGGTRNEVSRSPGRKRKENGAAVSHLPRKKAKEVTPSVELKETQAPGKSPTPVATETSLALSRPKRETGSSKRNHQSKEDSVDSGKTCGIPVLSSGKIPKKRGRKPKRKSKVKLKLAVKQETAHTYTTADVDLLKESHPPSRYMKSGNLKHCPKIAQTCETAVKSDIKTVAIVKHVVRPLPRPPPPTEVVMENGENHILGQMLWSEIFSHLCHETLSRCMLVCKTWYYWCLEKRFWVTLDFSHRQITQQKLIGIVRRQPVALDLSWTNISLKQLTWLKDRLPQMKCLNLSGCSWASVSCLCSVYCPLLHSLDISWVEGIDHQAIEDLLSPPSDHRPGVIKSISRLQFLVKFSISGNDITDSTFQVIACYLTRLEKLQASHCPKLTNNSLELLSSNSAQTAQTLKYLDISFCCGLTSTAVEYLKRFSSIDYIDVRGCEKISAATLKRFVNSTKNTRSLVLHEGGLIEKLEK